MMVILLQTLELSTPTALPEMDISLFLATPKIMLQQANSLDLELDLITNLATQSSAIL
jgi:hypothetical protein